MKNKQTKMYFETYLCQTLLPGARETVGVDPEEVPACMKLV